MPPRRSARNFSRTQPSNKDSTTSRPKRGSHGFHKFKNGLLNLTPVSDDETALVQKNTRTSGLLSLPPEVRMIIWGYALGGQTIKLAQKRLSPHYAPHFEDRFPLLRVSRQVYLETAILPYTLNTFRFHDYHHYRSLAKTALIKHVRHLRLRWSWWGMRQGRFPHKFPKKYALKSIEIVTYYFIHEMGRDPVQIGDVDITIRYTDWKIGVGSRVVNVYRCGTTKKNFLCVMETRMDTISKTVPAPFDTYALYG